MLHASSICAVTVNWPCLCLWDDALRDLLKYSECVNSNKHYRRQTSEEQLIFLSFICYLQNACLMKIEFCFWEFVFVFSIANKMDFCLLFMSSMQDRRALHPCVCTVTTQRWPFRWLRLCMRCCWANLWETVAGEQPCSNVCRCIPNWEIAFLVIAISICALLSLLSHFSLSSFSPSFLFLSCTHAQAHSAFFLLIVSPSPTFFSLSLTHIDSALEHVGVQHIL